MPNSTATTDLRPGEQVHRFNVSPKAANARLTTELDAASAEPYRQMAQAYFDAGWSPIPLPRRRKIPPPLDYTGGGGRMATEADVSRWIKSKGNGNIALRLPEGVVGLDVDDYDKKVGKASFEALLAKCGPLPATWRAFNRTTGVTQTHLYRVPDGLWWPSKAAPDIEIVRFGHRFVMAAPSVHPDGRVYRWYRPDNSVWDGSLPRATELPWLPDSWLQEITKGRAAGEDAPRVDVQANAWLDTHGGGKPCLKVAASLRSHLRLLVEPGNGARHDAATAATYSLVCLAAEGHSGVNDALGEYGSTFVNLVTDDHSRSVPEAFAEMNRMIQGATERAAAKPLVLHDECDAVAGHEDNESEFKLVRLSEVKAQPVTWLWAVEDQHGETGLIPEAELTLLSGREGLGKSTLVYQQVADITRGNMPGSNYGKPREVLLIATEDSLEHTIKPRLVVAGADLDKVAQIVVQNKDTKRERGLDLALDLAKIETAIREVDAALVVIDPLMSRIDSTKTDAYNEGAVRAVLDPVADLAHRSGCAVLGIMHLNKGTSNDLLTAMMGSRAFALIARSVLAVVRDAEGTWFGQAKSNLGREFDRSVGLMIVNESRVIDGHLMSVGRLEWTTPIDRPIKAVFAEAQSASRRVAKPVRFDEAAEWLRKRLVVDEPVPVKELLADATAEGFTRNNLYQAVDKHPELMIERERANEQHGEATWTRRAFGIRKTVE